MPVSMMVVHTSTLKRWRWKSAITLFQLALGHLAVGDADARFGYQFLQLARGALDAVHFVVQEVDLAAALPIRAGTLRESAPAPTRR